MPSIAVVVVTHNSGIFFPKLLFSLQEQTLPIELLVVVDAGSDDTSYLKQISGAGFRIELIEAQNLGFSEGNNLGWKKTTGCDYVFFLNPDAFPFPDYIERAVSFLEDPQNESVGGITGTLLGYDIEADSPTGKVDSTGIERSFLGHLADRDQGEPVSVLERYNAPNSVSAICGAALFCRQSVLVQVAPDGSIFDERFFMYKEDVDLSWRITEKGWRLFHLPELLIYHCRGWKKNRSSMPRRARLGSARNEFLLYLKHPSPYIVRAFAKYLVVLVFDV